MSDLQLPAKRVLEGKVIEPLKITITLPPETIEKLQQLDAAIEGVKKALRQFEGKARLLSPFEKVENGDVIDGECVEEPAQ